jgi:hypothetical protein
MTVTGVIKRTEAAEVGFRVGWRTTLDAEQSGRIISDSISAEFIFSASIQSRISVGIKIAYSR